MSFLAVAKGGMHTYFAVYTGRIPMSRIVYAPPKNLISLNRSFQSILKGLKIQHLKKLWEAQWGRL